MERPELDDTITLSDFESFYWLKKELMLFCRDKGIVAEGKKPELEERIRIYLKTGTSIRSVKKKQPVSGFNWKTGEISPNTIITDSYRNTENVRKFMMAQIGEHFRFNVTFCDWMKENAGKTMYEALETWKEIRRRKKENPGSTVIGEQFRYNTYIRDFMSDNPALSFKDAVHHWNEKKKRRGDTKYSPADLLGE